VVVAVLVELGFAAERHSLPPFGRGVQAGTNNGVDLRVSRVYRVIEIPGEPLDFLEVPRVIYRIVKSLL
jgi:hypothetical protein